MEPPRYAPPHSPFEGAGDNSLEKELIHQVKRAQLNQEIQLLKSKFEDLSVTATRLKKRVDKTEHRRERQQYLEQRAKETGDKNLNSLFRYVVWVPAKQRTSDPKVFWRSYAAHQVTWSISGLIMAIPIVVLGRKWLMSDPEAERLDRMRAVEANKHSTDPLAGDPLASVEAFDKLLAELTAPPRATPK